jgi:outer membrane protein TolC
MIAIPLLLAALQGAPLAGDSLSLSLDDAIDRARRDNAMLVAVRSSAEAERHRSLDATRAFLPSVELGLSGVRTTDPVGAFGLKLRQENFASADLALDALNAPEPYGGFTSSATLTLPLFAPEGLFGHAAATRMGNAKRAEARRMEGATVFQVVQAYWGAQLAARRAETLATAMTTARAHVDRAEALRAQGMVTGLDARLARVRAAEVETRQLAARAQAANAVDALAMLIGLDPTVTLDLSDSLDGAFATICTDPGAGCALDDRADLEAVSLAAAAAVAGVRSAWGRNLPSVALFGTVARHARGAPWSGGSGDWTMGFVVKWNVLQGLGGVGAVRAAAAQRDAAEAQAEMARRQAALEVESATRFVRAAAARVGVATAGVAEARAALAQAELRYQQGQSPITELLDVQAATTAADLNLLGARHDLFVAQASLDFAYGVFDR